MASVSVLTQPLHWQTPKPLSYGTLQRSIVNVLTLLWLSIQPTRSLWLGTRQTNTVTVQSPFKTLLPPLSLPFSTILLTTPANVLSNLP
jgi:hypothetical protein